ncbi:MAG: hypothetical protein ABI540_04785 [Spartobacteria bacterium]
MKSIGFLCACCLALTLATAAKPPRLENDVLRVDLSLQEVARSPFSTSA